jgi:hypothetical protein
MKYTLYKYSAPGWFKTFDSELERNQEIYDFLCSTCRDESDDLDSMLETACGLELGTGEKILGYSGIPDDILTEEEQLEEDIRKTIVKDEQQLCYDRDMNCMPFQYRTNMKERIRDRKFSKLKKSRHDKPKVAIQE